MPDTHTQGGFIWDWIDQGIQEIDEKGNVWFAYGGDYGETEAKKTHDANFNINGMISPDRAIHPAMVILFVFHRIDISNNRIEIH